ncbi:MAG TPA: hypothetical protein VF025_05825 [Gaiellaceae bacterium]
MAALKIRFCDELEGGFGWIVTEFMERCSHALVVEDRVWVIDPVDGEGVEDRIRAAGEPAGVIQLLDRHNRDCASLAARLGVRHHVVPTEPIPPFSFLPVVRRRRWREAALWWPEQRLLACADALGSAAYYCAGQERLAVHPVLRLRPPRLDVQPDAILCGHGEGVLTGADDALREALSTSRRRIPLQLATALRAWVRRPS